MTADEKRMLRGVQHMLADVAGDPYPMRAHLRVALKLQRSVMDGSYSTALQVEWRRQEAARLQQSGPE